jgi:hypothetical protein
MEAHPGKWRLAIKPLSHRSRGAVEFNRGAIETQPWDIEALRGVTIETSEGWPLLLTAEVNGDS